MSSSLVIRAGAVLRPLRVARNFSSGSSVPPSSVKVFTKAESRDFMAVFPDLVRELSFEEAYSDVPMTTKHIAKVIQYNVPTGKKNRGMAVSSSFKLLTPAELHTPENIRLANILGWCVEMLQAFFLVADDIMDGSTTRRGQECWYKKNDIGLTAFNDAILLETCIYSLLKTHFADRPYYREIVDEFHETTRHTSMGQCLDLLTATCRDSEGRIDLSAFDMKRYSAIVKYKTAYYTMCLPLTLAMHMADIKDPNLFRQAKQIMLEMGRFFQIQDDYLDCFGDPSVTGKLGTDIQDGKCSWLIVVAMQRANKDQKMELQKYYGSGKKEDIDAVIQIYKDLKLQKVFKAYEEETYKDIELHILQLQGAGQLLPPKLFYTFLDRIYKRNH